ncbi:MAG: hypothetical protein HN855_03815 [Anaerolineae bacterium]|jgi:hypothetical protein|nr:hypothetical protein [Anaerolineae bacterium]MBT7070893.1 hypothetical protein [Anaerolineae bacterium]MBT7324260.1 hypothetical protein [Anaerolineae bacterium]
MGDKDKKLSRIERLKMARAIKQKEVDHRREKRWKIFSWTSSLLVGSIAGAVAITSKVADVLAWWPHKILLVIAVLVLSAYSILWIRYNGVALKNVWGQVVELDHKLDLYDDISQNETTPESYYKLVSYGNTIALLAATAILIIVLS